MQLVGERAAGACVPNGRKIIKPRLKSVIMKKGEKRRTRKNGIKDKASNVSPEWREKGRNKNKKRETDCGASMNYASGPSLLEVLGN